MPDTIRSALERALDALDGLQQLGEDVEDEWTYLTDLGEAWRQRLEAVADARGDEQLPEVRATAVAGGVGAARRPPDPHRPARRARGAAPPTPEAGRITDPHRAIDWMSTFPQIVLVAVGEQS
jgi:hypothetical protein